MGLSAVTLPLARPPVARLKHRSRPRFVSSEKLLAPIIGMGGGSRCPDLGVLFPRRSFLEVRRANESDCLGCAAADMSVMSAPMLLCVCACVCKYIIKLSPPMKSRCVRVLCGEAPNDNCLLTREGRCVCQRLRQLLAVRLLLGSDNLLQIDALFCVNCH